MGNGYFSLWGCCGDITAGCILTQTTAMLHSKCPKILLNRYIMIYIYIHNKKKLFRCCRIAKHHYIYIYIYYRFSCRYECDYVYR